MLSMYLMKSPTQAKTPKAPAAHSNPPERAKGGRRIQVRRSGVHGKGVFATATLEPGERLIEYTGQRISWQEALDRHPHDPLQPDHTFYFQIEGGQVIDALYGGNASRWINHACEPNCKAEETEDGRVFIHALRPIGPGEELFYDYGLVIDERYTPALKRRYECRCGSPDCRRTMLAPKRAPRKAEGE